MARRLVRSGHQVTVLAEIPNHPSGIIPGEYIGKVIQRENMDGIDVVRVWIKPFRIKTTFTRMAFYLSYMFSAILAGLLYLRRKYDLIYASSPPLFVGLAGLVISLIKRAPMVFEVRDLWPESAAALGEITNSKAIAIASMIENACYRRAEKIVIVTRGIMSSLIERNIPAEKLSLISNGADTEMFRFRPEGRRRVRAELGVENKFVAIYAGIHGIAQGLETIIAAARLTGESRKVQFVLIGEGPKKTELMELKNRYFLSNLTFVSEKPHEEMPDYLSAADVSIVPLRRLELFKGALPTKLFEAWACRRPVVLGVDGEARTVLDQAGGGVFFKPEDPKALADAILFLEANPDVRDAMGRKGCLFTDAHYSRESQAARLVGLLDQVCGKRKDLLFLTGCFKSVFTIRP